ncbi:MAG: SLC13 family permease, partial [Anaerolineales bacterium]
LTGLVTPQEALSGFSNPAVVTVWAVFVLSGGMSRTGVANVVGRGMLRLAGRGEARLLIVIMLISGVMSAFMNNVGVAALLLPVVVNIARRTNRPPSKLLMPLAFGSLLGGMLTLIGTPPNILASDALADAGLPPFELFDFAPVGLAVMLAGIVFMALIGRHLLPARNVSGELRGSGQDALGTYGMQEWMYRLRLPAGSTLAGKTLAESRLGSALGLNVLGIARNGETQLFPAPTFILESGDELLVSGRLNRLTELQGHPHLVIESEMLTIEDLVTAGTGMAEVGLSPRSPLLGKTLQELDFRQRFGVVVLALWRGGAPVRTNLDNLSLQPDDLLLVQGERAQIDELQNRPDFDGPFRSSASSGDQVKAYRLDERLIVARIPVGSALVGKPLSESRLAEAVGLTVLGIAREGETHLMPAPSEVLRADDRLLVKGKAEENLSALQGLQALEISREVEPSLQDLETEEIGLAEAVLSPHTTLTGKTLRQLHFREKYGLNVLAIWREGRAHRSNLQNMRLRFGDALLLFGRRDKLQMLSDEADFLILGGDIQESPQLSKAPLAVLIMAGVVLSVLVGWLPISIAAVVGGTLMVLTGCLNMEEAYRYIEWRAVFLIAGMLPLGIAMEKSGAARYLAEGMVGGIGRFGPIAIMTGLFLLATLASQVMPNPVVTVLMAPIALNTASDLGLSPFAMMMVIAVAASASFLSPVGHPAPQLIMG